MNRLPVLKFSEVARGLRRAGLVETRQRGSHVLFEHADGRSATVPNHRGRDLHPPLLRRILLDAGLSVDEFVELL